MRATRVIGCVAVMALLSANAWADQNWELSARNRNFRVHLPDSEASAIKSSIQKLRAAGTSFYVNFWATTPGAARATYPQTNGVSIVASVNSRNGAQWMEQIGKKSIGFMCQGTPLEPHQTGEVRIGDLYFGYSDVNSGGAPTKMSQYFQNSYNSHCEVTIPVTDAELKAFKAFYLARANCAIVDRSGQAIQPEFTANGATRYGRTWVEGCAAASSSSLDRHWMDAFRRSVSNIQAVGRRLGITEMAEASTDMADAMESLTCRLGLKQQCSPQGMVRRYTYANNLRAGMITILNDSQAPATHGDLKWDTSYHDVNGEAWSGMRPVPAMPDLKAGSSLARQFTNVRVSSASDLDRMFGSVR